MMCYLKKTCLIKLFSYIFFTCLNLPSHAQTGDDTSAVKYNGVCTSSMMFWEIFNHPISIINKYLQIRLNLTSKVLTAYLQLLPTDHNLLFSVLHYSIDSRDLHHLLFARFSECYHVSNCLRLPDQTDRNLQAGE